MVDAHYSGTYTRLVVDHVELRHGAEGVQRLLEHAGQSHRLAELTDDASWSSYDEFRRLLEAADAVLGAGWVWGIPDAVVLSAGSMPEATDALVAMGSVNALLAELNESNAGTTTIEGHYTSQLGPSTWDLAFRLHDGFEPFPLLCAFHEMTVTLVPRLFGCRSVAVEEVSCQRRGDHWCVIRLSWEEPEGDGARADFLEVKLGLVERRLEVLQETVADVLRADDLDVVLERIVVNAAGAVRAPGFVLALEPLPWPSRLLWAHGVNQDDAAAHAAGAHDGDLVVEIASARRRHGRLIAVGAEGVVPSSMHRLVEGYAQLAATALDSAIAVEEARRQAATARVLLDLSVRLATVSRLQELAQTLADAIPSVLGCDRSVVALVDGTVATPIAVHGYEAEAQELVVGHPILLPGPLGDQVVYSSRDDVDDATGEFMVATGSLCAVMVPIVVDGRPVAWISGDVTSDPGRIRPSLELEERLHGLAAQAGTALHNALLLERVRHQAEHDSLTGLPNRKVLIDALLSPGPAAGAVLFVDLDDFKDVNDGLGHHAGDLLLCQVAERLRRAVRDGDMVARLGGDEFAVLVREAAPIVAHQVAHRVIDAFREPFFVLGQRISISASVGLAADAAPDQLLRSADVAMYRAKAAGKGRLALFEPGMDHAATERLALHEALVDAIPNGELRLLYQPVLELADGRLRGGEALVRWEHPTLGLLTPDRFVGLAEDTGLINPLGAWVLREACRVAASWPEEVAIAVNLSPRQLDDEDIVRVVADALASSGIAPHRLVLEITENVVAQNQELVVPRLEALRALGLRIAVDDFGTGYSSLGTLVHLPVDILKIDRSFITRMLEQPASADLVQVLIDMGRTLGLEVVAEGIERVDQAVALQAQRCRLGQGFLYSEPLPAEEFQRLLVPAPSLAPQRL